MRAAIARYGSPTCRNRKACSRRSSVRRCCGRVNPWRLMVSPLCVRTLSMCASVAAHARMTTQRQVAGAFVRPKIASSSAHTAWSRGAPSGAKNPEKGQESLWCTQPKERVHRAATSTPGRWTEIDPIHWASTTLQDTVQQLATCHVPWGWV